MSSTSSIRLPSLLSSFYSATFGVSASVSAKYGLTDDWTDYFVRLIDAEWKRLVEGSQYDQITIDQRYLFWAIRILFIVLQLLLNSFMLHYFVRSMRESNSLLASTYNQCFSIILAGVSGYLCFNEILPSSWIVGVLFIMAGVCFIQWGNWEGSSDEVKEAAESLDETKANLDDSHQLKERAHDNSAPQYSNSDATFRRRSTRISNKMND